MNFFIELKGVELKDHLKYFDNICLVLKMAPLNKGDKHTNHGISVESTWNIIIIYLHKLCSSSFLSSNSLLWSQSDEAILSISANCLSGQLIWSLSDCIVALCSLFLLLSRCESIPARNVCGWACPNMEEKFQNLEFGWN